MSQKQVDVIKKVASNANTTELNAEMVALTDAYFTAPTRKTWQGAMTQSSTTIPTANVFINSLGGTIVWTRTSAGLYVGTLAGAFPIGTFAKVSSLDPASSAKCVRTDDNTVTLTVKGDNGTAADALLTAAILEISAPIV